MSAVKQNLMCTAGSRRLTCSQGLNARIDGIMSIRVQYHKSGAEKCFHRQNVNACSTQLYTTMTSSNRNIFRATGHLCGSSPVTGEFPTQRPVTRSFDVVFDLRLNKRLSKKSWLWRHCNVKIICPLTQKYTQHRRWSLSIFKLSWS